MKSLGACREAVIGQKAQNQFPSFIRIRKVETYPLWSVQRVCSYFKMNCSGPIFLYLTMICVAMHPISLFPWPVYVFFCRSDFTNTFHGTNKSDLSDGLLGKPAAAMSQQTWWRHSRVQSKQVLVLRLFITSEISRLWPDAGNSVFHFEYLLFWCMYLSQIKLLKLLKLIIFVIYLYFVWMVF